MAVTYTTAVKNARMDAVEAQIDAGAGAGYIEIGTTGMAAVLSTITLDVTGAGAASGGVLTFSSFPKSDTSAAGTGTAAAARIRDGNGTDVVTGLTVGLTGSGADIELDSVDITAGQTVTLNSATITHA